MAGKMKMGGSKAPTPKGPGTGMPKKYAEKAGRKTGSGKGPMRPKMGR